MRAPNWFVGAPVTPAPWLSRLTEAPAGVRVYAAEDLHLTVAFLGAVSEEAAEAAFAHAPAWPLGPTWIALGPLVPLGRPRNPSALAVTLCDPAPVAQAIAEVRAVMCAAAGVRSERRPPLPHVTVARPRRRAQAAERRQAVQWARAQSLEGERALLDRLVLYTWASDRIRRQFTELRQHVVGGP